MPEARLIDTNVLVYLTRRDPALASLAAAYRPHVEGFDGVIAFVTLGELRRWPIQEGWSSAHVTALEAFIGNFVVYHTDDELCRVWGRLIGTLARAGRTLPLADSWIAATALVLGLPLVTNNRRHFDGIPGLMVISEEA